MANAGLLLPATLAPRLGLPQLVDRHLDLGRAPGRANTGDKMMTLVASALAGGDCIDDADVLRAGGTARALGGTVKAPSTLGTFLRSFRWGHVRQLDQVSRELLARAWQAGAVLSQWPLNVSVRWCSSPDASAPNAPVRRNDMTNATKRGLPGLTHVGPAARAGEAPAEMAQDDEGPELRLDRAAHRAVVLAVRHGLHRQRHGQRNRVGRATTKLPGRQLVATA